MPALLAYLAECYNFIGITIVGNGMKTIELPDALAKRIEALAAGSHIEPQAIISVALENYEERLRLEMDEGFQSGKEEGWLTAEDVFADARTIIEKHARRQKEAA